MVQQGTAWAQLILLVVKKEPTARSSQQKKYRDEERSQLTEMAMRSKPSMMTKSF